MSLHQRRVGALQGEATDVRRANQGVQVLHQCLLPYALLQLGADRAGHCLIRQRLAFDALVDAVVKAKPSGAKGKYLRKVAVSSSMGPGVKIDVAEVSAV